MGLQGDEWTHACLWLNLQDWTAVPNPNLSGGTTSGNNSPGQGRVTPPFHLPLSLTNQLFSTDCRLPVIRAVAWLFHILAGISVWISSTVNATNMPQYICGALRVTRISQGGWAAPLLGKFYEGSPGLPIAHCSSWIKGYLSEAVEYKNYTEGTKSVPT